MEPTRLLSSEKIIFLRNTDLCARLPVEVIEAISVSGSIYYIELSF